MKVAMLDDYHDTAHTWRACAKRDGHNVIIRNDASGDIDALATRIADALVLTGEPIAAARDFITANAAGTPSANTRTRGQTKSTNFQNLLQKRN